MCHPCLQYLAFACLSILTVILQAHPPFNSGSGQTLPCLRVLPIGHTPPNTLLPGPSASCTFSERPGQSIWVGTLILSFSSHSPSSQPFHNLNVFISLYYLLVSSVFLARPLCCMLHEGREGAGFACHLTPGTSVPQRTGDQEIRG